MMSIKVCSFLIVILSELGSVEAQLASKKNATKLRMLVLLPHDNSGQTTLPACSQMMRFVMDHVNKRQDILSDYFLEAEIRNEGGGNTLANAALINFDTQVLPGDTYLSPVMFGPTVACQNAAHTVRMLHYTTFSPQCHGPFIASKRIYYSTLYPLQMHGDNTVIGALALAQYFGNWKQVALLTDATNPNVYMTAERLYQVLTANSIKVLYYSREFDITLDSVMALKQSGARIIMMNLLALALCVKFYCYAHMAGIKPPLYVFVNISFCAITVDLNSLVLPQGCTRDMVADQLKISFFSGYFTYAIEPRLNEPTTFGYSYQTFEQNWLDMSLQKTKAVDYNFRHVCHDSMMAAVLTLNQTEAILNQFHGKSLKDFKKHPDLVENVANATAARMFFVGLRVGPIGFNRHGYVSEDVYISQMTPSGPRVLTKLSFIGEDGGDFFTMSNFKVTPYSPITWYTKSGQPPKDLTAIDRRVLNCGSSSIGVIVALNGLVSILQLLFLILAAKNRQHQEVHLNFSHKFVVVLACWILNAASAISVSRSDFFPAAECKARPILTVIGLSIINGSLLMHIVSYSKMMNLPRKIKTDGDKKSTAGSSKRSGASAKPSIQVPSIKGELTAGTSTQNVDVSSTSLVAAPRRTVNIVIFMGMAAFVLVNAVVLALWYGIDPVDIVKDVSDTQFDDDKDTYFDTTALKCTSDFMTYWLAVLLILQTFVLFIAAMMTYDASRRAIPVPHRLTCRLIQLGVVNACFIFVAVVLILLIVSSSAMACIETLAFSLGLLFYSLSTSSILLFPKKSEA